jgi:HNH endonuclease
MRLAFCAACGVTEDLQYHHLVTGPEGGSDDERNLITLCDPCHAKLRARRSDGPTATDRLNEAAGIAGGGRGQASGGLAGQRSAMRAWRAS